MFGYKNTVGRTLILASVLTLTGGVVFAQPGQGPRDGDGPPRRQADGDGQRQRGPRDGAGERGPRGPRDGEGMQRRLFAGLDLTDDQKSQIQDIMKAHGEERRAWHEENKEEIDAVRQKMRAARQSEDNEAMDAARQELRALMESAPKPDATHDEIRALLNEEQQATFDERVAQMRERADGWRERRGEGPNGPPPPGAEGGPRGRGGQLFANLDLSEDQQAKIREIMQSDRDREAKMTAVREALTEDQKAQLDENIERMRQWREENRGDRPRRGQGPPEDRPRRGGNQGDDQLDL